MPMPWFRSAALALCLALTANPSAAQEASPSHLAAARDLIQATGSLTALDEVLPGLVEEVRKQGITRPEMAKDLDEVLKGLAPELELQRQQAVNIASRIYAKWLSEPEMREVATFFKTPVGAKFAKIQPDLSDNVVNEIQSWSQQASEYVMVRTRVEMRKRGHEMQ
jgi:hypothetical protein